MASNNTRGSCTPLYIGGGSFSRWRREYTAVIAERT